MDRINNYKTILKSYLETEVNQPIDSELAVPRVLSTDDVANRYILLAKGWLKKRYIHYIIYHIEIIEDKIWVHEDRTDRGIFNILVDLGIPKKDIILGYLPQYAQKKSDFAITY